MKQGPNHPPFYALQMPIPTMSGDGAVARQEPLLLNASFPDNLRQLSQLRNGSRLQIDFSNDGTALFWDPFNIPKHDFKVTSIRELLEESPARGRELFDRCYKLYEESFPDRNEIQSAELLLRTIHSRGDSFDMLALTEGERVLGVRHISIIQTDRPEIGTCIVDEHLYVDRSDRKRGIGRALIEETEPFIRSRGVHMVFAEINDPNAMTHEQLACDAESGITTHQRVQFWKKCGYDGIDAQYAQPPLEAGLVEVHYLRMIVKRLDRCFPDSLPTESYIAILKAYHSTWVGDVDTDPLTASLYQEIKSSNPVIIPIVDLEQERRCCPPQVHPERN